MSVAVKQDTSISIDAKRDLIKRMFCRNASNDELELFITACKRYGLDPFSKQIYAIKYGPTMCIQTSIDGFRLIAERTGKYAPGKEPSIAYDEQGHIESATSYVKKQTADGSWHEVAATAYFDEYKGKSSFWDKMPRLMIAKCAEALAIRKAFPAELSGIYTADEMSQAEQHSSPGEMMTEPYADPLEPEYLNEKQIKTMSKVLEDICSKNENFLANFEDWISKKYSKDGMTMKDIYTRDYDIIMKKLNSAKAKVGVENGSSRVA